MPSRFGLEIRAADARDADGLAALLGSSTLPVDARALATRLQSIRSGDGVVLVAVEWGPPSGVIALNWSWTLHGDLRAAFITMLIVDPEARRKGIARLLLKAASQAARAAHCGDLVIAAATDAADLQAFCQATGFVASGETYTRSLRKRRQVGGSTDSEEM